MQYNKSYTPTIPNFVADYIHWARLQEKLTIRDVINFETLTPEGETYNVENIKELSNYVRGNSEIMAMAWLYGYKLEKRKYIEVAHERDWDEDSIEYMTFGVEFIGQRPDIVETFDTLQHLYKDVVGTELTMEDALCNMYSRKEQREIYNEFIEFYPYYKSELTDFNEVAEDLTQELFEFMVQDLADLKVLIESNDFQIGTVGRSDWTHYIMHIDCTDYSLPLDLWEGYNFYTISLMDTEENGLFVGRQDSIHHIYAPNTEDIFTAISDHFGIAKEDVYLLENDITQHLLDVNKVIERTEVYYEPKNIKY